jgi:hypothetical protein
MKKSPRDWDFVAFARFIAFAAGACLGVVSFTLGYIVYRLVCARL